MMALAWTLFGFLCVGSAGVVGWAVRKALRATHDYNALVAAVDKAQSLEQTLALVLDGEGQTVGQLMLPGKVPTDEAVTRLLEAQTQLHEASEALRVEMQRANAAEAARTKAEETLLEVADKDNVLVQIRVPGEVVHPNRTPCGALCKHAYWDDRKDRKFWRCRAGEGYGCRDARPDFLDATQQCTMFTPKEPA